MQIIKLLQEHIDIIKNKHLQLRMNSISVLLIYQFKRGQLETSIISQ